ncbi:MAG: hypothetical protein F4107_09390 [Gemmatimonadetes bacterium]|nr:hypothetical protein [Gemmatimonadota bacterium]MYD14651.1 hypothetical protein [Gemmatimonadota bacterium]MYI66129.1 hypothetical protein [Gemmatimonadota bacterium]
MNTACHTSPALLATVVSLAGTPHARAQQTTILTEDLCTTCTIELTPDAVLSTDGESVIGIALDIQRLSDGSFVMAFDYPVPHEFTVFSAGPPDGWPSTTRRRTCRNTGCTVCGW